MEKTEDQDYWIVDTDPGCDDMIALFYLFRKINNLLAITLTEGNCLMKDLIRNVKKVLTIHNSKYSCYIGCSKQIIKGSRNAYDYHYADGLCGIKSIMDLDISDYNDIIDETTFSAVKIVELINKYPNKVNLLCIAPLTNIVAAYMLDPTIVKKVKNIVLMGGSFKSRGNVLPTSEFNFAYDYGACHIFLQKFKNILIIPWEPTEFTYINLESLATIKERMLGKSRKINEKLYSYLYEIIEKYSRKKKGVQICDLFAIMSYFNHKIVQKWCLAECNTIIDSDTLRGLFYFKNKIDIDMNYSDYFNNYYLKNIEFKENYNIIVEEIDYEEIINEFEIILLEN